MTNQLRNYTWDPANRLTQISGSSIASFQYDPGSKGSGLNTVSLTTFCLFKPTTF
jgi:hypothetical protein